MHGPEQDADAPKKHLVWFLLRLQRIVAASLLFVDPGSRSFTPTANRDAAERQ